MNLPSSNEPSDEPSSIYTPSAENYQALLSIITNEVASPEILPYTTFIDSVLIFAKNLPQTPLNQFSQRRILQLLSIYINSRIQKIEKLALFSVENLSQNEKILAEQIGRAQRQIVKGLVGGVQERVEVDLGAILEEDFQNAKLSIQEIIDSFKVFCRFLEVQIVGGQQVDAGVTRLIEYGSIRESLINGQAVIVGFCDPWK